MHRFIIGLLIFATGWGLARLMYSSSDSDPQKSVQPAIPVPSISIDSDQSATAFTQTESGHVGDIANLLQRYEFEAALERYEILLAEEEDETVAAARAQILSFARQLIAQRHTDLAARLLQRFLLTSYRDAEARILLAEAYLNEENIHAAIDQFYEARGYAYRPAMLQRINTRIRSAVTELARSLESNNDQNSLLALYQQLTQLEPDYAPWFIGLAAAQLALDDQEAARRSLVLVAQDPDVGARAQAMLSKISIAVVTPQETEPQDFTTEVVGIPLHRSGNHFVVDTRAEPGRNVRLLIDTGASVTILTPDVIEQRGIRYQDTGRTRVFNTANGPVRTPVYRLDSLTVGDWKVNQLEIGVLDLGAGTDVDGLLGMNFLRHFQFYIDQNEAMLLLSVN
jgi:clan AA aspartic protease (TIGR02281 family)